MFSNLGWMQSKKFEARDSSASRTINQPVGPSSEELLGLPGISGNEQSNHWPGQDYANKSIKTV
jgi:hypothetical protein